MIGNKRPRYYWLDGHTAVPTTLEDWATRFNYDDERHVGQWKFYDPTTKHEVCHVSTVFLGLDHGWDDMPPLLFETMIFMDGELDNWCHRYTTWEQAETGHAEAVKLARVALGLEPTD